MLTEGSPNSELSEEQIFAQVRAWVKERCERFSSGGENLQTHLDRAADWVRGIDPAADLNVVLAAQLHDIDRAFLDPYYPSHPPSGYSPEEYEEYSTGHSRRSARIACRFLRRELKLPEEQLVDILYLIQAHETGGNYRQSLVQAADSLSFLETRVGFFIEMISDQRTSQEVQDKIDLMYQRIQIKEARELALPLYEEAKLKLEAGQNRQGSQALWAEYWRLAVEHSRNPSPTKKEIADLRAVRDQILTIDG